MSNILSTTHVLVWVIAALSVAGVIVRPMSWPEAVWAVSGAVILSLSGLIPLEVALQAVLKGSDVYMFLIGMMLLAEMGRREGLFDWLAADAARRANGSSRKLFSLVYAVGTVVTVFLSNDAAAVVLTPAVYAATKAAGAKPLPYLLICAFIANAASFVLPISNPANLVVFGQNMPPLLSWLARFAVPSIASIGLTFALLWFTQRQCFEEKLRMDIGHADLQRTGKLAGIGIGLTAVALLSASALHVDLGAPTLTCGLLTAALILVQKSETPIALAKEISWQVLPLVAGLFVLVEAVDRTGLFHPLTLLVQSFAKSSLIGAPLISGIVIAFVCNLVNNLPLGLIAGTIVNDGHLPTVMISNILIGVDLGPNLSVTGSLATILWLVALRREGQDITAWQFLKLGLIVMPLSLIGALACCIGMSLVFH